MSTNDLNLNINLNERSASAFGGLGGGVEPPTDPVLQRLDDQTAVMRNMVASLSAPMTERVEIPTAETIDPREAALGGGLLYRLLARGELGLGGATGALSRIPGIGPVLGGAGGALASLGPVGIAAGAVTGAFTGLRIATSKLDEVFERLADDIAPLSMAVSQAEAERELSELQLRLRRAELLGPDVAEGVRAQTRSAAAVEQLRTDLLSLLLPVANEIRGELGNLTIGVATTASALARQTKETIDTIEQSEIGSKLLEFLKTWATLTATGVFGVGTALAVRALIEKGRAWVDKQQGLNEDDIMDWLDSVQPQEPGPPPVRQPLSGPTVSGFGPFGL